MIQKRVVEGVGFGFVVSLVLILVLFSLVYAAPEGPSAVTIIDNTTRTSLSALSVNLSGGYIMTVNLTAIQTNTRWKGFVGNVTGQLVLQNSAGSTLYDWTLSSTITGEVYSSRSSSVTWANINCTWAWANGSRTNLSGVNNRTFEENESAALGGFTADDNISATFDVRNHSAVTIGTVTLPLNYCWNTNPYVNNVSNGSAFDELVLYDNASLVYTTILQQDELGFNAQKYDFEMIVPHGSSTGTVLYYFYVEVT